MHVLQEFLAFLTPYGTQSYIVMFGVLIACGFGLPMPEDIVLVTGGILASHGVTELWIVNSVCLLGVLGGDSTIFFLGRRFGPNLKNRGIFRRIFTEKRDLAVKAMFDKYHDKVIFMARFMPGLRTPIFFTSATFGVPYWKFLALDGFAALISVPLWIWLGFVFGKNLEELERQMRRAQLGLYTVLIGLVALFIAFIIIKRRTMKKMSAPG